MAILTTWFQVCSSFFFDLLSLLDLVDVHVSVGVEVNVGAADMIGYDCGVDVTEYISGVDVCVGVDVTEQVSGVDVSE